MNNTCRFLFNAIKANLDVVDISLTSTTTRYCTRLGSYILDTTLGSEILSSSALDSKNVYSIGANKETG
jgi:hypothetical protein